MMILVQTVAGSARTSVGSRLQELSEAMRLGCQAKLSRQRAPLDWAKSLGNQGGAMILLAERTRNATTAETACRQIEYAY
jgi:hypothetical protein